MSNGEQAEVLTGMMIVKAVQEGLELCDRFVLYASRNSLGSRWVLKEGLQAIECWKMQVTIIVVVLLPFPEEKTGTLFRTIDEVF